MPPTEDALLDERGAALRGFVAVVVKAIKSDGHASEAELNRLSALCALSPLFSSGTAVSLVGEAVNAIESSTSPGNLDEAAILIPPYLRPTAFAFATEIAVADGSLTPEEEVFLGDLAEKLDVPEHLAQSIVMASIVRNRGWT